MDKASLIGVFIGAGCLGFVAWHGSHGHLMMFYSQEGVFTVIGGSISVIFMALPMDRVLAVGGYIKHFMFHKAKSPSEVIQVIAALSEKARRDGILADSKPRPPTFLSALKMAVDGVDPVNIESTLRMEVLAMQDRHKSAKSSST